MVMQYQSRPVVVEAWRVTATNRREIAAWIAVNGGVVDGMCSNETCRTCEVRISTSEGRMVASVGDWVIRGEGGRFHPCRPEVFKAIYETLTPPSHAAPSDSEPLA